jgi:broad specificity phosphatase PhoE
MKKLVLIRHSKTIFEKEIPAVQWILSDAGQEVAAELAEDPVIAGLEMIYCSDQTKALETAVILARPYRHQIKVLHDLTELTSITKKYFDPYVETVHALYSGEIENINGGESLAEGYARFSSAVDQIASECSDIDTVAVVAHANILSIYASHFEERSAFELHEAIQMPDVAVLDWQTKKFDTKFGELK